MDITSIIRSEIIKLIEIEFNEKNLIGKGEFSQVYIYEIKNTNIIAKIFQENCKDEALDE